MTDQRATTRLIIPKSVENEIDSLRIGSLAFASTNESFDFDQALNDALVVGKILSEQRTASDEQQPELAAPGRLEFLPIPNVPDTFAPELEQLPFRPSDQAFEFQPIPNAPDGPVVPIDGHNSFSSPFGPPEHTQTPSGASSASLDSNWGSLDQGLPNEPDSATLGLNMDEDDPRYKAIYDLYKRYYPDQPGWSKDLSNTSTEHSSVPSEDPKSPDQGTTSELQEILPTVKSGCEAMVKLAEFGDLIHKLLTQLLERIIASGAATNLARPRNDGELSDAQKTPSDDFESSFHEFQRRNQELEEPAQRVTRRVI